MQKIKLKNGLTVIYRKKKTKSLAIEILVKVGSNNEKKDERGLSHFIEHLIFEGTKKRRTSQEITNEIEKVGGEINAYTSSEKTCYFIQILNKHFEIALDILADIIQNPLFEEKIIEKEKEVVNKEIALVNDSPRFYQWILFEKNLYKKHPTRNPTYGDSKVIANLKRDKIVKYYQKYYTPNNMILTIVGDIKNWKRQVEQKFVAPCGKNIQLKKVAEPLAKKIYYKVEKRKIKNTYLILGFKTVPRNHKDSYILDVIDGILGRGQSGWMFNEIRAKRGLAYEVGTHHTCSQQYGYFAIYLNTNKKNIIKAKKLILEQLNKLKGVSASEIIEAKNYLEGSFLLELEDTQKLADGLAFWEQIETAQKMEEYIHQIKKVTKSDITRVVNTYFKNYCLTI